MGRGLNAAVAATVALLAAPGAGLAQPPQRQRLAYVHDGRIHSIAADGSGRTLLVGRSPGFAVGQPHWSPDGSALAYTRSATRGEDDRSQIVIRDARGTRPFTALDRNAGTDSPVFAADGRTLAFGRSVPRGDDLETQIVLGLTAGGTPRVIARTRLGDRLRQIGGPAWAPDGRVAYSMVEVDRTGHFRYATYTVRTDGTDRRLLLRDGYQPRWSPDGTRMAFVTNRDRNGEDCGSDQCTYRGELYVANADGRAVRRLTRSKGDEGEPSWSADGTRLLFSSSRNFPEGQGQELYTITPEGRCLAWLTNGSPPSTSGDWQPGSGTRADAGGCGALGRAGLNETPTPRPKVPTLWLGRNYRGLLLTDSQTSRRRTHLDYEDCDRFDPRACPPGAFLTSASVCQTDVFQAVRLLNDTPTRRFRGGVLATPADGQSLPEF